MEQPDVSGAKATDSKVQADSELIAEAKRRGPLATLRAYTKLSGPGWLQSAITLGGGSLASSLYLGVLGGFAMLWLQPLAMILGIIMLSAIAYVALSTGERPFRAINQHVNPVLGWGWILATMMANVVWSLPQFSLATAAVRQNLLPEVLGPDSGMAGADSKLWVVVPVAIVCIVMVWSYESGRTGRKVFSGILKVLVAAIVLSFFGVVIKLSVSGEGLDWGRIFAGFIPDTNLLSAPAKGFTAHIDKVAPACREFWTNRIVSQQRNVMIAAAATAVGINMTFLLPYSMLKRGWDRRFRGLAVFDLGAGLFVPFVLATGCVVIVAAQQFHTVPGRGLLGEKDASGRLVQPDKGLLAKYKKVATERIKFEHDHLTDEQAKQRIDELPPADKRLAAMLVKRDAFDLAASLKPLTGKGFSHYVFGFGVLGMAVSTIIILMLINGFVICEVFNVPSGGWPFRIGCLLPAFGILGPFIWTGGKAQFWLAVPTSNIAFVVLPIAYVSFALLMNQRSLLGEAMPRGAKRLVWNILMFTAVVILGAGCVWKLWSWKRWLGLALLGGFVLLCLIAHVARRGKRPTPTP